MSNFSDTLTSCDNGHPYDGWYRQQHRFALGVSNGCPVLRSEHVISNLQPSSEYLELPQLTNGGRVLKTLTE